MEKEPSVPPVGRPRLVRRVNSRPASREASVDAGPIGAQDPEPTVVPRRVSRIFGRGMALTTFFRH